jgi:dihydroneopterin aldolase/D-erythro-7,8-dihydroneopterin triphosphate epimerase
MPDCIEIHDLLLRTIIGINPDERVNRQDVIINVRLETDVRAAAKSDRIEDAVNYRDISKDVIDLVEGSKFQLVERLADAIARLCLRDPSALRFARSVGVTIERGRGDVDR